MLRKVREILSVILFVTMVTIAELTRLAPTPDELKGKAAIEIRLDYIPKLTPPLPNINTFFYLNQLKYPQINN